MASEGPVVSDHSSIASEQVVDDEKVKTAVKSSPEQESSPAISKVSVEEEKPKAEGELLPALTTQKEKIEDGKIDPPPVLEEAKKSGDDTPAAVLEEKTKNKKIDPPPVEETKKTDDDAPVLKRSVEGQEEEAIEVPETVTDSAGTNQIEPVQEGVPKIAIESSIEKTVDAPGPSVPADSAKSEPEGKIVTESVERQAEEEQPKIVLSPEPLVEAASEPKVQVVLKEAEKPKEAEAPREEDKAKEPSEIVEQVVDKGSAEIEPKESSRVEIIKDEETKAYKVEGIAEKADLEPPVEIDEPKEIAAIVETVKDEETKVDKVEDVAEKGEKLSVEIEPKESATIGETVKDEETKADKVKDVAEKVEKLSAEIEPKEIAASVEIAKDEETTKSDKVEDVAVKVEKLPAEIEPKESASVETTKDEETIQAEKVEEIAEKVEKLPVEIEPKGSASVEIAKDEETTKADKIEELLPSVVAASSDQVTSANVEAQVDTKKDAEGEIPPSEVVITEPARVEKEKELSGTNVIEETKEEILESAKVELESGEKDVKTEELASHEKDMVLAEKTDDLKTDKIEDVNSPIPTNKVCEKSPEVETISRDIPLVAEKEKESIKDEIVTKSPTLKDGGEVKEKVGEQVEEPVEEPQKSEEVKTVQTSEETILEKANEASTEPPKEEAVSAKPAPQKHSNNLISKVKQSLVKAKKAIIGKSPHSKTVSSKTKADDKGK